MEGGRGDSGVSFWVCWFVVVTALCVCVCVCERACMLKEFEKKREKK